MNRSIFVVTAAPVVVIARAMMMSTVVTSDILTDSKRNRAIKNLDTCLILQAG